MNILDKMLNGMNRSDDDEEDNYFLDEDYDDEYEDEDDYDEDYDDEPRQGSGSKGSFNIFRRSGNGGNGGSNVEVLNGGNEIEIVMIKPTQIAESAEICNYLLAGKAVVLNMEGISSDLAQRIIDFTFGVTSAINGDLQQISSLNFMASPQNVNLTGEFNKAPRAAAQAPAGRSNSFTFNA